MNNLRVVGEMTMALQAALEALELAPADQVLVDGAAAMAHKLDTVTNENLILRYHAHYARYLAQLVKRSDANRDRRLAAEAEAAKATAAGVETPLSRLRAQSDKDQADREVHERREAAKAARLKARGKTVDEIAAAMQCHRSIVLGYLKTHRRSSRRTA